MRWTSGLGWEKSSALTASPSEGWTYWAQKNWDTKEDGYVVVAPSGARFEWVRDEAEALLIAETRNREGATRAGYAR